MPSELKGIEDQLRKLNQNIERYLRMIDPPHKPEVFGKIKGVVVIDPTKSYLMTLKDDVPIESVKEIYEGLKQWFPDTTICIINGGVVEDIEVKE